ncbi:MAG: hypothetical protein KGH53_00805 [Candidatus Micrarchaeota archaeon]|nr:hypothetical protein [Candidatus Micrarchaeota archaeon]
MARIRERKNEGENPIYVKAHFADSKNTGALYQECVSYLIQKSLLDRKIDGKTLPVSGPMQKEEYICLSNFALEKISKVQDEEHVDFFVGMIKTVLEISGGMEEKTFHGCCRILDVVYSKELSFIAEICQMTARKQNKMEGGKFSEIIYKWVPELREIEKKYSGREANEVKMKEAINKLLIKTDVRHLYAIRIDIDNNSLSQAKR